MNKMWKLSFNKKSAGDIASAVFFVAGILVMVGNGLGFQVASDQVDSWASAIIMMASALGLSRNTTGTSSSQVSNVSSVDASKVIKNGGKASEDAK